MGHGGGLHPLFVVSVGSVRPGVMMVVAESAVFLASCCCLTRRLLSWLGYGGECGFGL
jgi:hypothetical protein